MDGHADGIASARHQRVIDAGPSRVALFRIDARIPHDAHDFIPRLVRTVRPLCCVGALLSPHEIVVEWIETNPIARDDAQYAPGQCQ